MALLEPDHRALRIITSAQAGDDDSQEPLERAFFHLVKTGDPSSAEVSMASDLYRDPEYRHTFNALILAGANAESVAVGTGVSEACYETYRYLFFDDTVFPHNLAKTRYVRRLPCPDEFRQLYEIAIERGPSELLERCRIGAKPRLEPETLMYDAMSDMWSKFLSHRGYTVTSDMAKEALKWGEASLRTAKQLLENNREERRSAHTVDDLRIALEIRNDTKTMAELNVSPDDLVSE